MKNKQPAFHRVQAHHLVSKLSPSEQVYAITRSQVRLHRRDDNLPRCALQISNLLRCAPSLQHPTCQFGTPAVQLATIGSESESITVQLANSPVCHIPWRATSRHNPESTSQSLVSSSVAEAKGSLGYVIPIMAIMHMFLVDITKDIQVEMDYTWSIDVATFNRSNIPRDVCDQEEEGAEDSGEEEKELVGNQGDNPVVPFEATSQWSSYSRASHFSSSHSSHRSLLQRILDTISQVMMVGIIRLTWTQHKAVVVCFACLGTKHAHGGEIEAKPLKVCFGFPPGGPTEVVGSFGVGDGFICVVVGMGWFWTVLAGVCAEERDLLVVNWLPESFASIVKEEFCSQVAGNIKICWIALSCWLFLSLILRIAFLESKCKSMGPCWIEMAQLRPTIAASISPSSEEFCVCKWVLIAPRNSPSFVRRIAAPTIESPATDTSVLRVVLSPVHLKVLILVNFICDDPWGTLFEHSAGSRFWGGCLKMMVQYDAVSLWCEGDLALWFEEECSGAVILVRGRRSWKQLSPEVLPEKLRKLHLPSRGLKSSSRYKGLPSVTFSDNEVASLCSKFWQTLVGKFPKGRPSLSSIRASIEKIGFSSSPKVFRWTNDFDPTVDSPLTPVWIGFAGLPIHLFEPNALFSIGNLIGTPLKMDNATLMLSRPSVAHLCIELDLTKELPRAVWIHLGSLSFLQPVNYEDLPDFCKRCKTFGHTTCKKAGKATRWIRRDLRLNHEEDKGGDLVFKSSVPPSSMVNTTCVNVPLNGSSSTYADRITQKDMSLRAVEDLLPGNLIPPTSLAPLGNDERKSDPVTTYPNKYTEAVHVSTAPDTPVQLSTINLDVQRS
ncbi:unnamed protein product [Cuscuta campestris]|uniref:Uncharacterized protein n=1 Tax=Cuscuta campestris TaxID=132261 RepID=A0A484M6R7_9ASTE|nr:unnamed protein product [Cuscuta campestris]